VRRPFRTRGDAVEVALRADRPEPGAALVADLSAFVSASPMEVHRGSRLAFASALAVLVIGTFLSFGGAAYAANGATQAPATPASTSAAADEYGDQAVAQVPLTPPTAPTSEEPTSQEPTSQEPTSQEPKSQEPTTQVEGATATAPAQKSGTLPFTGVGLGSTALVSLLLVSLGVYLRRRESRE
jgi:hypothetical protein